MSNWTELQQDIHDLMYLLRHEEDTNERMKIRSELAQALKELLECPCPLNVGTQIMFGDPRAYQFGTVTAVSEDPVREAPWTVLVKLDGKEEEVFVTGADLPHYRVLPLFLEREIIRRRR